MNKGAIAGIAAAGILVLGGLGIGGSYNGLVTEKEQVESAWSKIDVQLQSRMDKLGNLEKTASKYLDSETKTMKDIAEARSAIGNAKTPEEKAAANEMATVATRQILAVQENYPNLKSDKNFATLMDEISGSENRIAVARKDYNDEATEYNTKVKKFPTAMIAGMFNFDEVEYFKAQEGAEKAPELFSDDEKADDK